MTLAKGVVFKGTVTVKNSGAEKDAGSPDDLNDDTH